jgi:hypothetical protein
MRTCGLNSLVFYLYVEIHDIWERNMTIRNEIQTKITRSLGFQDLREGVTLGRLMLRSLECI